MAATVPAMGKSLNQVLADNLRAKMEAKGLTQKAMEAKTGIAQTTISLYLRPDARQGGTSGQEPSGKLSQVAAMAAALDCEPWELLVEQPFAPPHSDFESALLAEIEGSKVPGIDLLVRSFIQRAKQRLGEKFHTPAVTVTSEND